jgi:hypothetical protein
MVWPKRMNWSKFSISGMTFWWIMKNMIGNWPGNARHELGRMFIVSPTIRFHCRQVKALWCTMETLLLLSVLGFAEKNFLAIVDSPKMGSSIERNCVSKLKNWSKCWKVNFIPPSNPPNWGLRWLSLGLNNGGRYSLSSNLSWKI